MVQKISVEGYNALQEAAKALKDKKVFVMYSGSIDSSGNTLLTSFNKLLEKLLCYEYGETGPIRISCT